MKATTKIENELMGIYYPFEEGGTQFTIELQECATHGYVWAALRGGGPKEAYRVRYDEVKAKVQVLRSMASRRAYEITARRDALVRAAKACGFELQKDPGIAPTHSKYAETRHFLVKVKYSSLLPGGVDLPGDDDLAALVGSCLEEMRIADHAPMTDGSGEFECDWISVQPVALPGTFE